MSDESNYIEHFLCSSESGIALLDSLIQANISPQSISMDDARRMLSEHNAADRRLRLRFA